MRAEAQSFLRALLEPPCRARRPPPIRAGTVFRKGTAAKMPATARRAPLARLTLPARRGAMAPPGVTAPAVRPTSVKHLAVGPPIAEDRAVVDRPAEVDCVSGLPS